MILDCRFKTVELLLKANVDLSIKDKDGQIALHRGLFKFLILMLL